MSAGPTLVAGRRPEAAPDGGLPRVGAGRPLWLQMAGEFVRSPTGVAGLAVLAVIVLFSFVGPLVYHTNQFATNLILENEPPSLAHVLGTTPEGRDQLGALMVGGQSTLEVGLGVGVLSTAFGLVWGAVAGYIGGLLDAVMMRIVDALLSIPFLFFVVLLAALTRPSLILIIFLIAAVSWLPTARLARGDTLGLRTNDYVVAARGFGASSPHIVGRHITPNLLGMVIVNATLKVADAILLFAAMSFLGLGVPPPATNWGDIVTNGVNNLFDGYWWQLWPAAVLIVATVLGANLLGDALRDVVEPRLSER